jgi:predicted metalloprotease with PDZ domain
MAKGRSKPGRRLDLKILVPFVTGLTHRIGMTGARRILPWTAALLLLFAGKTLADTAPIMLIVDATDAPRGILHARLQIPASPGKLTLYYPKWLPGEHAPDGPINNVTGLKITPRFRLPTLENPPPSSALTLPVWRRDDEDMFTFYFDVPAWADGVEVRMDFLLPGGGGFSSGVSSTAKLLDLNWNQVLLYPKSDAPLQLPIVASLILPEGWKFGTALPVASSSGKTVSFSPAPLETLIDSPVVAGEYFREIDLSPGTQPPHFLDIVADSAAALEIRPEQIQSFSNLVRQANALFGAQHYRDYHFLLTLSDRVAHFGLEHHESSDDRLGENYLTDDSALRVSTDLLPHEMTHSWNGKYRRPAGLATPDYQQPMRDELLWVYEGLTDYLGKVLAARSGLQTNNDFRETFALTAAMLDHRTGRDWRSLADTTVAAQLLYSAPGTDVSRRRGTDFYPEGDLIWLEADVRIRQQTHGQKSLDDFCKLFHGAPSGPPKVVSYSYDDVVKALNEIAPGDWNAFFQQRIYAITPRAPMGGIESGGWRLAYTNEVPSLLKTREGQRKFVDLSYSIGLNLGTDGQIGDVLPGTPADAAGIGSGMKLVAVNGRAWSAELLRTAVKTAATNSAPIELLVENGDFYQTCKLDYHGGEKYPVLERDAAKTDLLEEIIKPLTPTGK